MPILSTEPVDLKLGPDHDLVLDEDLVFTTGLDAVRQDILVALRMVRGEWFNDLDEGVPYLELLGEKYDEVRAREIFRTAILRRPHVVALLDELGVSFDGPTRTLHVAFRVRTAFGDLEGEV